MINWVRSLFTKKVEKRKYNKLTEALVDKMLEDIESGFSREVVMNYYGVSQYTYYQVKNKTHRHLRG